jgi:hypothetical protein
MRLQDPTASFSLSRPPLPEQDHPGLGVSREILEILTLAAERLELDGVAHTPSHYHIAAGSVGWKFLSPSAQGRFDAMRIALQDRPLAEATCLVEEGRLRTAAGDILSWEPAEMLLPLTEAGRDAVRNKDYLAEATRAREALLAQEMSVTTDQPGA